MSSIYPENIALSPTTEVWTTRISLCRL